MSLNLKLRGSRAVSAFRLDKLNSRLATNRTRIAAAEYWHFVETERPLDARETGVLERLLQYGEPAPAGEGHMLLSVPRLGTISPWSSKATDIARRCGLEPVRRIERGLAWIFSGGRPPDSELPRILALIHDRMTETVLASLDEADALFRHF
jgi:phosphoribosylformylglycinamidine synthase